jgi:hypothetical protein
MSHMSDLDLQRQIRETEILMDLGWTEEDAQERVSNRRAFPVTNADAQSLDVYEDTAGRYLDEPEVLYGDYCSLEDYYDSGIDF